MIRTDVPDFLFKYVDLTNLEEQNWNGKIGFVKEWSKKRERFAVQLLCDDSLVWIKPSNLNYYPKPENDEESELFKGIFETKSDRNFEQRIKLFDQLSAPEKYMPTYLKIFLCENSLSSIALSQRNRNCISEIQDVLKNIIENSCFDDLIVSAKLSLAFSVNMGQITMEDRSIILDLCNSSIEDNYGHLPTIFKYIVSHVFRHPSEWEPKNGAREKFEMLKNLYFKTKQMIKNKTFVNLNPLDFLDGSLLFLKISKYFEREINMKRETDFLLEVLDFLMAPHVIKESFISDRSYFLGKILFLKENYEEALKNFQLFQESMAAKLGNNKRVGNAYQQKAECYIKLGKKSMAKQVFKKLKRFDNLDSIDDLKKRIKAMPNEKNFTCFRPKQKNQNVRTPTKCSSYKCKKIEPYVGAFNTCAKCRLTYYCSKKCQRLHWKSSHKTECKEY